MSFGDHLEELRTRLLRGLIAPLILVIPALIFGKEILVWLVHPVEQALLNNGLPPRLQALSPVETFVTYMKIAILVAVIGGAPILVYQLWRFIAPGLYKNERRFAHLLVPMSVVLTTIGVLFLYYIVLPISLAMLIRFTKGFEQPDVGQVAPEVVAGVEMPTIPLLPADPPELAIGEMYFNTTLRQLRIRTDEEVIVAIDARLDGLISQQFQLQSYINLVFVLTLAFSIAFQLPLVILLLGWVGIVDIATLRKNRKYAFLGIVVLSAVLTPPDFISQLTLAAPLFALYELSMVLLRIWPSPGAPPKVTGASRE
ncbi:MAG: twin-arginine translocase subunit TatC [Phycisphaerales bacterium]